MWDNVVVAFPVHGVRRQAVFVSRKCMVLDPNLSQGLCRGAETTVVMEVGFEKYLCCCY